MRAPGGNDARTEAHPESPEAWQWMAAGSDPNPTVAPSPDSGADRIGPHEWSDWPRLVEGEGQGDRAPSLLPRRVRRGSMTGRPVGTTGAFRWSVLLVAAALVTGNGAARAS